MNNDLILRVREFGKSFGTDLLLEDADLIIHNKDKVGLLGQNGTGKTTFIKCLIGEEDYEGVIEFNPEIKFAVMEQEKVFDEVDLTFQDYLNKKKEELMGKKEKLEEQFADPDIYNDSLLYDK